MVDYMSFLPIVIRNKDGEIRKIHEFRKRVKYALNTIYLEKVKYGEELRVDLMANRLYKNIFMLDKLIDVNDIDLLSKTVGDELRFTI